METDEYPKYLIRVTFPDAEPKESYMTKREAGIALDSGVALPVGDVLDSADTHRRITEREIFELCEIADEHSGSK